MKKSFWDKIQPKGVVDATPWAELLLDAKGKESKIIKLGIFYFILADFLVGFIMQLIFTVFNNKPIIIFSCFEIGFQYFLFTLLLFAMMSYGTYLLWRSQRKTYKIDVKRGIWQSVNGTYGNQHFQDLEEQKQTLNLYDNINKTTENVLGINEANQICCLKYTVGMNKNEIYFGDPGSGKSASIIKTKIYQTARRGGSMVVTDSKGDIYKDVSATLRNMGYIVRVINFKPEEFKNSDGFDLFSVLNADDEALDSKADVIAHSIIQNTSSCDKEVTEYWGKNEFNLYKFLILLVVTTPIYAQTGKKNLADLFNLLSTSTPSSLAGIARNIPKGTPCRSAYDIFANCEERIQGQIINGAAIRLSQLSNPYLQEVLRNNEIDFVRPMKEKCAYFVIISDTTDAYGFLSSLFFQFMIDEQCKYSDNLEKEDKKNQLSVTYLLDEYKNVKGIPTMPTVISTVRSRLIELVMILQDLAQLEVLHGKENAATILNNCAIKGLLSTNDLYTAEYFEKLLGSMTIVVDNQRVMEGAADVLHAHSVQQKTKGEGERSLMTAAELTSGGLELDEIIYVIKGMYPLKLKKYFSEKAGEAIHPLEIKSRELGERPCNKHKPKWRKEMEDAILEREKNIQKAKADIEAASQRAQNHQEAESTKVPEAAAAVEKKEAKKTSYKADTPTTSPKPAATLPKEPMSTSLPSSDTVTISEEKTEKPEFTLRFGHAGMEIDDIPEPSLQKGNGKTTYSESKDIYKEMMENEDPFF